jgi:drug/metabolite transporter (DMT)-like permease
MPHRLRGIFVLLLVTLVWGTTFPAMKELSTHFSAIWIVFIRFGLAGLLLSPFLRSAKYTDVMAGGLLGATLFVCYMLQLSGLALTTSNRNAFITGLNVLVVPLLGVVIGRIPERKIVVAIFLAVAGLFLLCWDGGLWGRGDSLALCGAALCALCALIWLLIWERPPHPADWAQVFAGGADHIGNFLYLAVIATAATIALQTWGQRHSSANEAAVIYAFEPACAAIAAYFWLGETMVWRGVAGALMIIAGMVVSQWTRRKKDAIFASS